MELKKISYVFLIFAFFASVCFADDTPTGGFTNVGGAVQEMCNQLVCILPVISMLMVIGAGVVYAAGQMMGAETRARANTWATAMLVGAVIGILIVVVAPEVLKVLYSSNWGSTACTCTNAGGVMGGGNSNI